MIVDFPTYLESLAASLPRTMGITADSLIDNNTLWPYYAAFSSQECRDLTRFEMQHCGYPYLHFGLMASRSAWTRYLRYCTLCAEHDRREVSEMFWRRAHQLPGIEACPRHGILLQDSPVLYRQSRNRHAYVSAEYSVATERSLLRDATAEQLSLARGAEWLLNNPQLHIDGAELRSRYQARLAELGYASYGGRLYLASLQRDFEQSYSPEWLARIGCRLPVGGSFWVADMVRARPRSWQPIRHLLLMHFLRLTVDQLFDADESPHPFGRVPWPCLNLASEHYGSLTVQDCRVKSANSGRRLLGRFECPYCGFVYLRYGPDIELDDMMRRDHIPHYGTVWDRQLTKLWSDSTVSLRCLSERLGVDPTTAKLQAARLGLSSPRSGGRGGAAVALSPSISVGPRSDPGIYKSDWLNTRAQNPDAGRGRLRKLQPAAYVFLMRHQSTWLQLNSPPVRQIISRSGNVDWVVRDQEIAVEVQSASERLRGWVPPVRLTRTAILREAQCIWALRKTLPEMPLTAQALDQLEESRPKFAIRRISAVLKDCLESNQILPTWRIARMSGLRPDMTQEPSVRRALSEARFTLDSTLYCVGLDMYQADSQM
jgi:Tn7-like transposition protein D/TniQ